jgi:transcriptional regulator NrdR family protein
MIVCDKCGGDSMTHDSRPVGNTMRRRRVCRACGFRWTTVEVRREALDQLADMAKRLGGKRQWRRS